MTRCEGEREIKAGRWPIEIAGNKSTLALVRTISLIATIYLVGSGLFLAFLAIVFVPSSSKYLTALDLVGMVGVSFVPACCYALIGTIGLTFLPSPRFWILGLAATSVETALAIDACAKPGSLPLFTDWLL